MGFMPTPGANPANEHSDKSKSQEAVEALTAIGVETGKVLSMIARQKGLDAALKAAASLPPNAIPYVIMSLVGMAEVSGFFGPYSPPNADGSFND